MYFTLNINIHKNMYIINYRSMVFIFDNTPISILIKIYSRVHSFASTNVEFDILLRIR